MGAGLTDIEASASVDSLNRMFNKANIKATFENVENLRKVHDAVLDATKGGVRRHRSLRFAAFMLTDQLVFDGTYPAHTFKSWLRWLTWLNLQTDNGQHMLDGASYRGAPHDLIMQVLRKALPPNAAGPAASEVHFNWSPAPAGTPLMVTVDTSTSRYTIDVVSLGEGEVDKGIAADAEDDF